MEGGEGEVRGQEYEREGEMGLSCKMKNNLSKKKCGLQRSLSSKTGRSI